MKEHTEGIVVHGNGLPLLVASAAIMLIALGMPLGLYLSGTPLGQVCGTLDPANVARIWGIAALIAIGLASFAGFRYSCRLNYRNGMLRHESWFGEEAWPVQTITDATYQRISNPDAADEEYLVLWRADEKVASFNLSAWPQKELRGFWATVRARHPALRISPEAKRFFEPA